MFFAVFSGNKQNSLDHNRFVGLRRARYTGDVNTYFAEHRCINIVLNHRPSVQVSTANHTMMTSYMREEANTDDNSWKRLLPLSIYNIALIFKLIIIIDTWLKRIWKKQLQRCKVCNVILHYILSPLPPHHHHPFIIIFIMFSTSTTMTTTILFPLFINRGSSDYSSTHLQMAW